ncbi:hypothetical protein LWI29_016022 [Acer saccharum]|uniref:Uncharacterized protein n=1 Tax=Acer saccharum TaxID=4024 RepID=A0AA39T3C1_ACESA|nr:hypothetical protein LWI29_016022 [Acer saccharum]
MQSDIMQLPLLVDTNVTVTAQSSSSTAADLVEPPDSASAPVTAPIDSVGQAITSTSSVSIPTLPQPWSPASSPRPATTAATPTAESTTQVTNNMSQPMNNHHMQTRAKDNIRKLIQKMNLHSQLQPTSDCEPTTFMHQPTSAHWDLVKRLLRYLYGTLNEGVVIHRNSQVAFHAFSDVDWAGNNDDFSSTSAYIVYLGWNPISWSSKKQHTIARSSTEAKYRSVAATAAELNWVCFLLTDLGLTLPSVPVIYCDNVGATQLCSNPIFHSCMKHVTIDFHFIRDQVQSGSLRMAHISSSD